MNWWEKFWCYNFGLLCKYVTRTICLESGKLATENCPKVEEREFLEGEEPKEYCNLLHYNICPHPVKEIGFIIGDSVLGYEGLVMDERLPHFTDELIDQIAEEMAPYINTVRLFAYISEDPVYVANSVNPIPKVNGKYDFKAGLDDEYVKVTSPRLKSFHKRQITTINCLASGIKEVGGRWNYSIFNGKNNVNQTTENRKEFMQHPKTIEMFDLYMENMVRQFDNDYIIWEFINEPIGFGKGEIFRWYKARIQKLYSLGVPYHRIAIEGFNSRYMYELLPLGIWCFYHGCNSPKTIRRWHTSKERKELYDAGKMCASGDGGDEFGQARGLVEFGGSKFRRASSEQMYKMIRYDLDPNYMEAEGKVHQTGNGIEFMSASPFCFGWQDCYWPNLTDAIRIGTKGLSKEECQQLGVDYNWNWPPEWKRIYHGYKDSQK